MGQNAKWLWILKASLKQRDAWQNVQTFKDITRAWILHLILEMHVEHHLYFFPIINRKILTDTTSVKLYL